MVRLPARKFGIYFFLFIMLGVILWIGFPRITMWYADVREKATVQKTKNVPEVPKKYPLSVHNNRVVSADGQRFIIRGVTTSAFRYEWPDDQYENVDSLLSKIDTVVSWGANTIQLYLNPDIFDDTEQGSAILADVKRVVDWGKQKDLLIILNPVNDVRWDIGASNRAMRTKEGVRKRDAIRDFLARLADTFCAYPNVMFSLEAEPKFIDTVQTLRDRVSVVANCQNPVLMPMVNFSGSVDIEEMMREGIGTDNVILDYHAYKGANIESPGSPGELVDMKQLAIDTSLTERYAVIFGEFGGFWKSDFNTEEDLTLMMQVADFAHQRGIGVVTFSLDEWVFSVFDEDGAVTERGEAIRKILTR